MIHLPSIFSRLCQFSPCLIKSSLINPAKNFFHPHPARWLVVQLTQEDGYEFIEEVVGMLSSMLMYELMTLPIPLKNVDEL
jgi:hypothetical protein